MSKQGHLVWGTTKRPMVITLMLLFIMNLSIMPVVGPIIPNPGPSVSPGNICCDDCSSLSIPVKNIKDVIFNGRIEIKITLNDNIISQDSISITLSPGEERVIKTPICPPCSSLRGQSGTYQITTTVIEDSGKIHDSKSTYFAVQNCPSSPKCSAGPTETYQCIDNKVKRLYKNADCTEHWEIIKDCDQCKDPPCKCAVGSCIHDEGTGEDEEEDVCDPTNCQSLSGPFSTPYYNNGEMYQRYKECACVDDNCECKRIDKQCTGKVYGNIYDKNTNSPIKNAIVFMSQNNYLPSAPTNDDGYFSFKGVSCPSTLTTLSCLAEGYEPATKSYIFTDNNGDLFTEFMLSQLPSNTQSEDRGTLIKIIAYFEGEILKYKIYGIPIESPSKSWILLRSGEIICDNIGDDYKNYCELFDDFSKPADAILDGVDLAKTKSAIESAAFGFANAANELMPLLSRPEAYLAGASTAYSVFIKVGGVLKGGIIVPAPDLISKLLSTNDPNFLETEKWTRVDQGNIL